ncbi:GNAT family N-acetyltransferase [Xanthomonas axonopodis]|uniref:GNAT family N-acetyltransferase n=1 Tax=Xanthomonas axonopodis TaxID=53413 RepID=UPI003CCEEC6D
MDALVRRALARVSALLQRQTAGGDLSGHPPAVAAVDRLVGIAERTGQAPAVVGGDRGIAGHAGRHDADLGCAVSPAGAAAYRRRCAGFLLRRSTPAHASGTGR